MAIFGTQAKKRKETRGDKASYAITDGLRALGLSQYDASRYGRKLGTPLGAVGDFLAMPRDAVDAHFAKQDEALRAGNPQTFLNRLPETLNVITSGTDLGPTFSMAAVAAKPVVGMFGRGAKATEKAVLKFSDGFHTAKIGDSTIGYTVRDGIARINSLKTPEALRGKGSARLAMTEFLNNIDERGLRAALTPEPMDAKTKRAGLEKFYESLGFFPNKGKSKDFSISETMLREPVKNINSQSGIIAYHGSPHNFDAFDMSKIGTGEGAQAYGHGLYFAESEDVAKQYRQQLSGKLDNILDMRNVDSALVNAAKGMREYGYDEAQILDVLRKSYPKNSEDVLRNAYLMSNPGSMYQVRIDVNPDDLLDWDKPLSQQSMAIQTKANQRLEKLRSAGAQIGQDPIGQTVWKAFNPQGGIEHTDFSIGPAAQGAQNLLSGGIPGIKYLDAGSRGIGEGSRNFVVFDDKLITILKKYGWVPGTAVPAALMSRAQAEAQAQDEVY